jgi:hopanoid biosynthesis associated RND transporter like protein HpnN
LISRLVVALVDLSRRMAGLVVLVSLLIAAGAGWYTANHIGIDTDTSRLLSPELSWRKAEIAYDNAFPRGRDVLLVVVDGPTADAADDAAAALAERLAPQTDTFLTVTRPDGGPYFATHGLLYLETPEVQAITEQLIAAQPLIGELAADPSLRGLMSALGLVAEGIARGDAKLADLDRPAEAIADSVTRTAKGEVAPLSWQQLMTGRKPSPSETRKFIIVQPKLDYTQLEPGSTASKAIRAAAADLKLDAAHGIRVRLTGSVALSDEELASVAEGTGLAGILSTVLVVLLLFLGVRSARLMLAIMATTIVGLVLTGAFATAALGTLNMLSVAFAVLFLGLAVDFGIQFSVRYRDERYRITAFDGALRSTAARVGVPLMLAAAATATGFLSFLPTEYRGISELGLISGVGMGIAFLLTVTLLPALLALLRPSGEEEPVGFAWAEPIDAFLVARRRQVLAASAVLALVAGLLATQLRFDFNPLNLKDPNTESMSTLIDMMKDPDTAPNTLDAVAPNLEAAQALAKKIDALPEVRQTATLMGFVPDEQDAKLALISDAALLLGPTLAPPTVAPPPSREDSRRAVAATRDKAAALNPPAGSPAAALVAALDIVAKADDAAFARFEEALTGGLARRLQALAQMLEAAPVTVETLPPEIRENWLAADGRARIQIWPKGDSTDNDLLKRFVAAVRTIVPDVTGAPVSIQESSATIIGAFVTALILAVLAIMVLLGAILRRGIDVVLVLLPLMLAALLTAAVAVLAGIEINFANIVALPLMLGIGVAFDIYFVMNWRVGITGPLQSATARAVLFSAGTTVAAFGSLAVSSHPGTSGMGVLLTLSLAMTLVTTLGFLPSLLAAVKPRP